MKILIPLSIALSSLDLIGVILLGSVGTLAFKIISADSKPTKLETILKSIFPRGTNEGKLILYISIIAIVVLSSKTLSQAIFSFKLTKFLARIETEISSRLYRNIVNSNLNSIQKFKYNDYQFSLLVGVSRMCIGVINNFIMLITDLVVTLLMGCLAFYASKSGFLIALFIIVVIYFFVNGPVQRKAKNYGSKLRNTQLKLGQEILENISGIKEIKTYGKEDSIYLEFLKLKSIHSTVGQRSIWINTIVRYFLEIAILLIGFFLILFLTMTTDVRHSVTIVVVFMSIGFRLIPNIQRIQNAFVTFKMSTEMTSTLFELEKSFSDKFPLLIDSKEVNVRKKLKSINLRNVGFSYENAISPSVSGVNLKILAGQCLVIVGKSGSGKTTLVDIIAGLNAPSAGTIDYEFTEPEAGNGAVKPTISYVSQGSSLFGEDVYQNVSLSTLSSAIERKIIDDIAVEFELSFLRTEQSLGREIRSDGTNLSGGERQRVALARAKYFNSDLVIFDEPTSSLDPHNAEIVLKYMRSLRGISTMVIVTHSKDLMDLADLVLELENSEVKFCGEVAHYLTRKED